MSLTIPGSNFKLKNDNKIYQFVGYNCNNDILYRYNDNNLFFSNSKKDYYRRKCEIAY